MKGFYFSGCENMEFLLVESLSPPAVTSSVGTKPSS